MKTMLHVAAFCWLLTFAVSADEATPPPTAPRFPFDAASAAKYQADYARWSKLPAMLRNSLGQQFSLIPPGEFVMGSPNTEPERGADETQFIARLTKPFYLSRHETTVKQFREFVERTNFVTDGERNGGGNAHDELAVWKHRPGTNWRNPGYAAPLKLLDSHPVVHVSHADALAFCRWLDQVDPTHRHDLPSEAEWEWACRSGAGTRFTWGDEPDSTGRVANVGDQQLRQTLPKWPREVMAMNDGHPFLAPVGSYHANAFGLYDMLGNVWEFCSTRSGAYPTTPTVDPGDLATNRGFAVRGGGWSNTAKDVRCATRNADPPHFCHSNLGFRVAIRPTTK